MDIKVKQQYLDQIKSIRDRFSNTELTFSEAVWELSHLLKLDIKTIFKALEPLPKDFEQLYNTNRYLELLGAEGKVIRYSFDSYLMKQILSYTKQIAQAKKK